MNEKNFACVDGTVFKDGKPVGWYHINKKTQAVKATAKFPAEQPGLPDNIIIAFGANELECSEGLERSFKSMGRDDD